MKTRTIVFTVIGSLSGSVTYFVSNDLYHIYITKKRRFSTNFNNFNQLVNPGLFVGAIIGFIRGYTNAPVIKYFDYKS